MDSNGSEMSKMPNMELLEQTLTFIKDHPEQHHQQKWTCEAGACFAGHAAMQLGWAPLFNEEGHPRNGAMTREGKVNFAWEIARRELDMVDEESDMLFYATNSIETIELMVKDIANGLALQDHWVAKDADGPHGEDSYLFREEQPA